MEAPQLELRAELRWRAPPAGAPQTLLICSDDGSTVLEEVLTSAISRSAVSVRLSDLRLALEAASRQAEAAARPGEAQQGPAAEAEGAAGGAPEGAGGEESDGETSDDKGEAAAGDGATLADIFWGEGSSLQEATGEELRPSARDVLLGLLGGALLRELVAGTGDGEEEG